MPVVISMLRGINLARHHRIKMDQLRTLYESLGLMNPQTYVQSGNVVFQTGESELTLLAKRIERAFERSFGFRSNVVLRTASELRQAVAKNPFAGRRDIHPSKLLVTFLAAAPGGEAWIEALSAKAGPEEIHGCGREVYIYYPHGMGRSKLSWTALADQLRTPGTGRNWNTVTKLLEMAEAMES